MFDIQTQRIIAVTILLDFVDPTEWSLAAYSWALEGLKRTLVLLVNRHTLSLEIWSYWLKFSKTFNMGEKKFKTKACPRFQDSEGIRKEKAKFPAYSWQNHDWKKKKKREKEKRKKGTC